MINYFKILIVLLVTTFSFVSCIKEKTTRSPAGSSSITGLKIKWPSNLIMNGGGINLKVSNSINSIVSSLNPNLVNDLANKWNATDPSRTFFKTPFQNLNSNKSYTSIRQYNDNEMGIYTSSSWFNDVPSQVLAITQFYGRKKNTGTFGEYVELFHVDIILNQRDFRFSPEINSIRNGGISSLNNVYDVQSVILHEMGHFIGIGHSSFPNTSSVMYPYLNYTDEKRTLSSFDTQTVLTNYTVTRASSIFRASSADGNTNKPIITNDSYNIPLDNHNLNDPGIVSGRAELWSNGSCHHIINNKEVYIHSDFKVPFL